MIGQRNGARITYLKRVRDHIEISNDDNGEHLKSMAERTLLTEERIHGIAKNMPVVGRWRSKNGKLYYMAVNNR